MLTRNVCYSAYCSEAIKIAIVARTPMTRNRLEEKIAVAQKDFDDAIEAKDYKAAGPLQDTLEELKNLRQDYPSLEELKEIVKKAEEAVASAAKRRDFANAASLQNDVKNARARLQDALDELEDESVEDTNEDEDDPSNPKIEGIESRADLENELKGLHEEVDAAIAKKDFNTASKLQVKIEEREKLRSLFPSLAELEEELSKAKKSLDDAIASKNFEKAAKLDEEVAVLEKKVADEREKEMLNPSSTGSDPSSNKITGLDGEEIVFESRRSLEMEIKKHVTMQANEVSSKNFSKAQEIQAFIDRLESLRGNLPTVSELRLQISERKSEMDKAISEKRFTDAEKFDKVISDLEEKLSTELKSAPAEESAPLSGNVSISVPTKVTAMPKVLSAKTPAKTPAKALVKTPPRTPTRTPARGLFSSKRDTKVAKDNRQVAKLRPKKPLISSVGDSVLSVTQMLASKRGAASVFEFVLWNELICIGKTVIEERIFFATFFILALVLVLFHVLFQLIDLPDDRHQNGTTTNDVHEVQNRRPIVKSAFTLCFRRQSNNCNIVNHLQDQNSKNHILFVIGEKWLDEGPS